LSKRTYNYMAPRALRANMRSRSKTEDPMHDPRKHERRVEQIPSEYRTLPGSPQHIVSNMPAVSSVLGMMGEKQARYRVEKDNKRTEYVGRTSKLPECGPSARKSDNHRAAADGK